MWFVAPGEYNIHVSSCVANSLYEVEKWLENLLRDPTVICFQVLDFQVKRETIKDEEGTDMYRDQYTIIVLYIKRTGHGYW